MTIQEQLDAALSDLTQAFAERAGRCDYATMDLKLKGWGDKKPEFTIYLSGQGQTVSVHHFQVPDRTIDSGIAAARLLISALRTYADECADLGIPVPAQTEEAA